MFFSVAFALLLLSPTFLSKQFGPFPLMKVGDVTDILTPLILIPLYWLLYRVNDKKIPGLVENIAFLILSAAWVEGHGMHLSANSIGNLMKNLNGGSVQELTNFYDEVLGHYLWHTGVMGLSALLIFRQWQQPFVREQSGLILECVAGIIYGFTYFAIVIEGNTALLGVLFAVLVTLFGLTFGRKHLRQQPILTFFLVAYLMATLLFLGWAIRWGGLPEFSKIGII